MLTSDAGKQLTSKGQDLTVGEGHKIVLLQEVKHALPKQIHDDANVATEIEAVPQMNATVPILLVVRLQGCQHPQFNLTRVSVLLYGADDLYRDKLIAPLVLCLYNFAESALAKELDDFV